MAKGDSIRTASLANLMTEVRALAQTKTSLILKNIDQPSDAAKALVTRIQDKPYGQSNSRWNQRCDYQNNSYDRSQQYQGR
jgi:hypothetical protein